MDGYVARKGDRYYAVIYEGLDPLTCRERRRWHPASTDRAAAERSSLASAGSRCDTSGPITSSGCTRTSSTADVPTAPAAWTPRPSWRST
jgi:hypothetical protein